MNRMAPLLVVAAIFSASGFARAQSDSGPKPGTAVDGFKVFAATGESAGKTVDFVADRKTKPTVYLFVQASHWDRPMARFIKVLDKELAEGIEGASDAACVAVWLTDDHDKSKDYLPVAQQSIQLQKTALTVFDGDTNGPPTWSIDAGKFLTAVIVRDGKVVKSAGYSSVNETDVPDVVKSLKKP